MATMQQDISQVQLFHELDTYPWDADEDFQAGLSAILGSVSDPAQIEHLTLRAKCYYYARKAGSPIDFEGYKQWVENGHQPPLNGADRTVDTSINDDLSVQTENDGGGIGGLQDAPKPASFAEICEMISSGKEIPGIKEIPDTILEGQGSESHVQRRKKPWEKESAESVVGQPSWMTA